MNDFLRSRTARHVATLAAPVSAAVLSIAASWKCWISATMDSPKELEVPWRVACGERLYRDVFYPYGPLATWIRAGAAALFGRHFLVPGFVGLFFGALAVAAVAILARDAGSRLAAVSSATAAAALCFGAPNRGAFLYPYSGDAVASLGLSAIAIALANRGSRWPSAGASAICLGLALSGKEEIGIAAAAALVLCAMISPADRDWRRRVASVVMLGFAVALLDFGVALAGLPVRTILTGGPGIILNPPASWRALYRFIAGFDDPVGHLGDIATALFMDFLLLATVYLAAGIFRAVRMSSRRILVVWSVVVAGTAGALLLQPAVEISSRLPGMFAPMPILAALAAALYLRPRGIDGRARLLLFFFAAAVASRVVLNLAYDRVTTPYSIIAFPPLAAAAAVLLIDGFGRGRRDPLLRRLVAILFLGFALFRIGRLEQFYHRPDWVPVRTPAGSARLPAPVAGPVAGALTYLEAHAAGGDDLVGFPEGGFFGFSLGLKNPMYRAQILPGDLDRAGEAAAIELLNRRRPRFVLIANQATCEFGACAFGRDYARLLWSDVLLHYHLAAAFGDPDLSSWPGRGPFFVRIYECDARPRP